MTRGTLVDDCLRRWMPAALTIAGCCLVPAAHGQHAPVSSTIATLPSTTAVPRDTSFLREVERRVLPMPIVPGPNRYGELTDYYWAENRSLRERFELAKQAFQQEPKPTFRALTLVAGAAGVGKTFIKGEVFNKDFPASAVCKFDIGEVYDLWARDGVIADKPDLFGGDVVISRVKSVADKSRPRLREYLEAANASFYVIDSLDEIHPDDFAWILEQIEDFVFQRDRQFVHVAVFGRAFAFRDFWWRRAEHRGATDVQLYLLNPPTFQTTGDLAVSSWNYHSWKYRLAWAPDGNQTVKMPLEAYLRWGESGFFREGKFGSVTSEANDDMRADVQSALVERASSSQVIGSTLYNLAGNSLIRDILRQDTLQQRPFNERRVAEEYVAIWLVRETKVHDRPSVENPEYLDLYLSLLGQVAVKYLAENKIDDRGFFPVLDDDIVIVSYENRQLVFPVKRILDRSGLVVTDPRQAGVATRYRFEPVWIHRLLLEMQAERISKQRGIALGSGAN